MATPGKVSLKKKKLFTPKFQPDVEDFEIEKENSDRIEPLGTFKPRQKINRRNSTILAGNLTILNQDDCDTGNLSPNVTLRKNKIGSPVKSRKDVASNVGDLLTEDESSFYSCDESLNRNQVFAEKDPWMTELTEEEEDEKCKTPNTKRNPDQPSGSTVKAATFFSVGKRKSLFKTDPRRILAAGSDSSEEEDSPGVIQDVKHATVVADSDDDPEDDIPLLDLGRKYLSDSKFGKVASWVTKSPFEKKPKVLTEPVQRVSGRSSEDEIESLLKSDPEDGEVRPSWAAPLPPTLVKIHSKQKLMKGRKDTEDDRSCNTRKNDTSNNKATTYAGDRSSKGLLNIDDSSSQKTSTYAGDRSSKAPLSIDNSSSQKTSTYVGDRSSKGPLSIDNSSSQKTSTYVGDRSSKANQSVSSRSSLNNQGDRSSKGGLSVGSQSSSNKESSNYLNPRYLNRENDSSPSSSRQPKSSVTSKGLLGTELDLTVEKFNNLDIEESPKVGLSSTQLQSSLLLQPKGRVKPKLDQIQNSVNAVRCWGQSSDQSVSHKDNYGKHDSSSSDDFENFLTNLKTKKIEKQVVSSDENFIVHDEEEDDGDSDFDSPKLSLKDRILKKISTTSQPEVVRTSSDDDGCGLPDIDSPIARKKTTRTEEADVYVISSDEESDNLYEPKNYNRIPSPAPVPKVKKKAAETVKNVRKKVVDTVPVQLKTPTNPRTTLTFLSSLTKDTPISRCHPEAVKYVKNFKTSKTELAERLYQMYNDQIFENALPDDMQITWNVRLTKTAGLCYSKRHKKYNIETRSSRIELSTKVIDSGDRLRDTLIHEMCHAASWIISGYRDGHGPLWRTWAEKAMRRFPELPVIDRCHSYQINTKYTYRCVNCGYSIGRHSKSLDTERKVCGHCHGRFHLVTPAGSGSQTPGARARATTPFANFVKENYKHHRSPGVSHGDVMKILSAKFSETKLK